MTDDEIDEIWEDAKDAAINAWRPLGAPNHRANPYPENTAKWELWNRAFASCYASENGY